MNFFESLNHLKQKMGAATQIEPVIPVESVDSKAEPEIDILSWIDSHGITTDTSSVRAKSTSGFLLEDVCKTGRTKNRRKTRIQPTPPVENSPMPQVPEPEVEKKTIQDNEPFDWSEDEVTWIKGTSVDEWFKEEPDTVDCNEVIISSPKVNSFEEEPLLENCDEILEHLNQFGISLKSVDFNERRKKGEEGVYRSKGSVEKTVDLHGMAIRDAELKIIRTFEDAKVRGYQQILIIHGRGNHSKGGDSKMKRMVLDLLEGSLAEKVSSFTFAPFNEGGSGATRVILK